MTILLQALYFMLPAYVANMAPVFAQRILGSWGSAPINERLLGSHKTYRGFIAGICAAIVTIYLQRYWTTYALVPYERINIVPYGFLLGFGALFGDAVKSLAKRRRGIAPGVRWMPWDQLDFIIGALVFIAPLYMPSWRHILIILIVSPVLHILTNQLGYALGIKSTRW